MPLSQDEQGGGTNADGTHSTKYCRHCFQGGEFTQPDLTVAQMTERVKGFLKEMGLPERAVGSLAGQIPQLERWRS